MTKKKGDFRSAQARTHDYLYDPIFMVPTKKDYVKHIIGATLSSAQRDIAPIYNFMFCDAKKYPRNRIVIRKQLDMNIGNTWKDPAAITCGESNAKSVIGADRLKFFKSPLITLSPGLIPDPKKLPKLKMVSMKSDKPQTKGTQTVYRESSAQTTPWKPEDYVIIDNSDPEILMLDFLKEDLPPGMHEVEIIKRLRRKRGWLKQLPEIDTAAGLENRRQILEAIETDEWAFREEEIVHLQNLRLELVEKMLQEILDLSNNRAEGKLMRITKRLDKRRTERVKNFQLRNERELRRLYRNHKGIRSKYHQVNAITEYEDFTSELYAPMTRFGSNPRNWHEIIQHTSFRPILDDVEDLSTLPDWLPKDKMIKITPKKLHGRRLCERETKWTEPVLKQLYEELKSLRVSTTFKCTLRKRIIKRDALDETAYFDRMTNVNRAEYEAILLMQCVIRGRATQSLIFEGRDKCRELIQELQCTHALVLANTDEINQKRFEVKNQQRVAHLFHEKAEHLEEALNDLKCTVVGTLLDYCNKQLIRLLDERKAHAIAMMYERERRDREAAEGGRRQLEERRRTEHDEIFKQIVKVNQDTVDLYLRDIIIEGVEHVSDENAQEYVKRIAQKIDDLAYEPTEFLEKEENIADMVSNFLIPEVEKIKMRETIRKKQKKHLRTAHDSIYNKIEDLPNKRSDGMSTQEN